MKFIKTIFIILCFMFGINSVCIAGRIVLQDGTGKEVGNAANPLYVSGGTQWSDGDSDAIYYNDGNVGIGTSTPISKLSVSGDNTPVITIQSNEQAIIAGTNLGSFSWYADDNSAASAPFTAGSITVLGAGTVSGVITKIADMTFSVSDAGTLSEKIRLKSTGKVGIGTSAPAAKLEVTATTEQLRLNYNDSNYFSTTVGSTGAVTLDAVGSGASFNFSDHVGIGTTTPAKPLNILVDQNTSNGPIQIENTSNGTGAYTELGIFNDNGVAADKGLVVGLAGSGVSSGDASRGYLWLRENSSFQIGTNNTERIRILATGLVGIGTSSPTTRLQVNGGILPAKVTADPCGTNYPEGTLFYNDTSNYFCYCDGTNDVKMHDPSSACF